MQSKVQPLKAHSRCHWGLHQLNKYELGKKMKKKSLGKTSAAPSYSEGPNHHQVCLMSVSICTRRCEFPQYICEALNQSHCTLFPHYPLVSPEKGSSDLQTWLHRGTRCPAAEAGVRCDPQAVVTLLAHTSRPSYRPALSYLLEGSDGYVLHQHLM